MMRVALDPQKTRNHPKPLYWHAYAGKRLAQAPKLFVRDNGPIHAWVAAMCEG